MRRITTEYLDRNPAGIFLLNGDRTVIYTNATAGVMIRSADGLTLGSEGIGLSSRGDNARLQALIGQAIPRAGSCTHATAGGGMRAPRPSGKRSYVILVTPIRTDYAALCELRPAACVMISDPDRQTQLPADGLQLAFGLTRAEAALAVRLASGDSLQSAANALRITYGTARARLVEIFHKTDTRRQSDLVRLILTTLTA